MSEESLSPGAQRIRNKYPWLNAIAEKNRQERLDSNLVHMTITVTKPIPWIEIDLVIGSDEIKTQTRKLKATWTMETAQDLCNWHIIPINSPLKTPPNGE